MATVPGGFGLDGMTAIVVGGSTGIGRAAAEALIAFGATTFIAGRRAGVGEQTAAGIGASYLPMDVTDTASVDAAFKALKARTERLDIAVNAAGTGLNKSTEETEDAEFMRVIDTNLGGAFRCCRAEGQIMLDQRAGSIINIASMSAHVVNHPQRMAAYNASKAAIVHYTRSLAVEWSDRRIRVNSVSPGYTETAMTARGRSRPGRLDEWHSKTPLGRIAQPDEMAGAIVYLASPASAFTTGADIIIDGGYSLW